MSSPASPDSGTRRDPLRRAYLGACALELRALKPGNVHVHAAGHGMTVDDFTRSAEASVDALTAIGAPVGRRIRDAIAATRAAVGCNTNLGIVLLAAPLVAATETAAPGGLRPALAACLATLTTADAALAYEAIRLAAPAGLGTVPDQDVAVPPTVDLRQAMTLAASRDSVARQYATVYADVFDIGVARLMSAARDNVAPDWAASLAYLDFLAVFPDSHIERKHGSGVAARVRDEAAELRRFVGSRPREDAVVTLLAFDRRLKSAGLNPGTSADLTVASLLAAECEDMLGRARVL
jgi:triphosphoribosyl-dephospho-CoA synthase